MLAYHVQGLHYCRLYKICYCKFGKFSQGFTDIGKSCPRRDFLMSQICILTLFSKIKVSRKFPNLQHTMVVHLYYSTIRSLYRYVPVSWKANGDKNQLWARLT